MKIKRTFFIIVALLCVAFTSGDVYSKDNESMDVVLAMDSSGSMKKTDPMSLRIPAAKLFISLLDKNDRVSVVSFSDTSYPIINLTSVDSEINKDLLFNAADKISSAGLFTNLYDALNGGLGILSEGEKNGRSKIIVLMSDGVMDTGDADKDLQLVDKIKNEMGADLEKRGVKVYAIAFTEQSDRLLLEKISKRTGGFYNLALSDKDFHLIFTSIFESLKSPEMAPMSDNGFLIDGSIEEVTIVATKGSPQTQIRLNSPDGRSYSNKEKSTGIGWFVSDNFDMITIKNPAEGRWEILFSTGDNNKAYIITNLKLQTNFDQLYSTFGDPLDIKIWLEKDGIAIKEPELLEKFDIYIELTGPDGKVLKLKPFNKGEGIFTRNIAPFTAGNYKLRIVARGNTFEREKAFVFNIADVKESKEDILAKREKEKKAGIKAGHIPVEADIRKNVSWKKVAIQFISINLAMGIIALLYFKRKSIKGINNVVSKTKLRDIIRRGKVSKKVEEAGLEKVQEKEVLQRKVTPEEDMSVGIPEKQDQDISVEAKGDQKEIEDHAVAIEQNEDEAQIKEIPLEEEDAEGENKLEESKTEIRQEADSGKREQENLDQGDNEESGMAEDSQWGQVESNQHILSQDDLNQLLGADGKEDSEKEKGEQTAGLNLEDPDAGHIKTQVESADQEKTDDDILNEDIEDIDDLWQEALQSQKDAGAVESVKGTEEQTIALDLEIERLEKAQSEKINQLADAEDRGNDEITGGGESESGNDEPSGKKMDDNIVDNQQEDIDAIWQEALQQQKASEDGNKDNKESVSGD